MIPLLPKASIPDEKPFVAAMAFPNKEDAFPNLAKRIVLPTRKEPRGEGGRRRKRGASAGMG